MNTTSYKVTTSIEDTEFTKKKTDRNIKKKNEGINNSVIKFYKLSCFFF